MALFTIYSILQLSTQDRARIERVAVAVEAILAKFNEPGQSPEDLEAIRAALAAHDAPAAEALRAAGGPST
jgi:hypothetical protein